MRPTVAPNAARPTLGSERACELRGDRSCLYGPIGFRGECSHVRFMSIMAFLNKFPDDDACWRHLEQVRWPDGPVCAKCGNVGPTMACGRKHYRQCKTCNAKFTAAFGTPLEGTHLPMRTWFTALHLLAVSSKGLSSVALGRHLGVGQKTAWFLGRRIRAMMEDNKRLLRAIVGADATYVGGKSKRDQKSRRDDAAAQPKGRRGSRHAMVVTAGERGGKARAKRAGAHSKRTGRQGFAGKRSVHR